MNKKDPISYIDFNEDEPEPIYCPYCEKVGVKYKLQDRVYDDGELPSDADQWTQCHRCGRIIPVYATKDDPEYGPVFDLVETPFDSGSQFAGVHNRSGKKKKKRRANKLDKEEDLDIAVEQGTVNIVYDSGGNY